MNGKEGESNKTKAENVTIYEEFSFQDIPCSGQQLQSAFSRAALLAKLTEGRLLVGEGSCN